MAWSQMPWSQEEFIHNGRIVYSAVRPATLLLKRRILNQHAFLRVHIHNGCIPRQGSRMAIQLQIVSGLGVPTRRDPGLNDFGAKPNVVIVLARIVASRRRKCLSLALCKANKVGKSDFILETGKSPKAIPAALVAQQ
jgi:hypothetical protein